MKKQLDKSKKGEIDFRKKLVQQQVEGKYIFSDEFDADGIEKILSDRMKKTIEQIISLKEREIVISPYIEIGAERCQRSLVMENDLDAAGAAVDISFDMLKGCDYYKKVFNKSKVPLRICCDANNLPFMSDSVPFVFCYETLHHFPDPALIVKEIHRVLLPGGHFFFDEEPYKKVLHINLYKSKKIYSNELFRKSKIIKIMNCFFSERTCNEVEHGIIENDNISLRHWKQALNCFDEKNIKLQSRIGIQSELFNPKSHIRFILAYLFGGNISGVCRKPGINIIKNKSIYDVLICPLCTENKCESKLIQNNLLFFCSRCNNIFPTIDGVVFLFSFNELKKFYPEIFEKVNRLK